MTRAKVWAARRGLRGWGGVTGMAVACAVTASLTLLPLAHGDGTFGGQTTGQGVTSAVPAKAEACTDPEASLLPSTADGPADQLFAFLQTSFVLASVSEGLGKIPQRLSSAAIEKMLKVRSQSRKD